MRRAGNVEYDCLSQLVCELSGGGCLCPRRMVRERWPERPGRLRPPRADVLPAPTWADQFPQLGALLKPAPAV